MPHQVLYAYYIFSMQWGAYVSKIQYVLVEGAATTTRFSSGSGFSGNDRFSEKLSAKMDSFSRKGANSGF